MARWIPLIVLATSGAFVTGMVALAYLGVKEERRLRADPVQLIATTPEGANVYRVYDRHGSALVVVGTDGSVAAAR